MKIVILINYFSSICPFDFILYFSIVISVVRDFSIITSELSLSNEFVVSTICISKSLLRFKKDEPFNLIARSYFSSSDGCHVTLENQHGPDPHAIEYQLAGSELDHVIKRLSFHGGRCRGGRSQTGTDQTDQTTGANRNQAEWPV